MSYTEILDGCIEKINILKDNNEETSILLVIDKGDHTNATINFKSLESAIHVISHAVDKLIEYINILADRQVEAGAAQRIVKFEKETIFDEIKRILSKSFAPKEEDATTKH